MDNSNKSSVNIYEFLSEAAAKKNYGNIVSVIFYNLQKSLSFIDRVREFPGSPLKEIALSMCLIAQGKIDSSRSRLLRVKEKEWELLVSYLMIKCSIIDHRYADAELICDRMIERYPLHDDIDFALVFYLIKSTLATIRGDVDGANALAREWSAVRNGHWFRSAKSALVEKTGGDIYQDKGIERGAWLEYQRDISSKHTKTQNPSVWLQHLFIYNVEMEIRQVENADCFINYGALYGWMDHQIASRYPEIHVIGYDRSLDVKQWNDRVFSAPNLEYAYGDFEKILKEASEKYKRIVLGHCRTVTYLSESELLSFYRMCASNNVKGVVAIEGLGFSSLTKEYFDISKDRSVFKLDSKANYLHNCGTYLEECGYRVSYTDSEITPTINRFKPTEGNIYNITWRGELS
ncbi:hypothetical protein [Nisaea sediminum]|uniref:hypothetical protein n=1 Tax=Nisaea sediminum TaxID=2775867 RepID=UPI0018674703|nr:hypothetical protein [Nisaea sediminum]